MPPPQKRRDLLIAAILFAMACIGYFLIPWKLPPTPRITTLIAHRGVHHTFSFDNIQNDTCTAARIDPPTHEYFENTVASIQKAYEYGADMVEIDIHPTSDNNLAVFHDWTIDCRTQGNGVTHEQSMQYLKTLDIGYGYTADNGKTFPLRGKGVGLMPTFEEVLLKFPDKKLAVNQKDTFDKTVQLLAGVLKKYPNQQKNIYFFSGDRHYELLKKQIPHVQKILPTAKEEKDCLPSYMLMLMSGSIKSECKQYAIGIPVRFTKFIPGWPSLVFNKAHHAGLKIYLTDVDSIEDYQAIKDLPYDGIVTNKIEIIGPLIQKSNSSKVTVGNL